MSAEHRLAGGDRPDHYFGAATDAAPSLLWSTAEDVAATASGKQGMAVRAVIAGVEGNVPRGRFQVPPPADEDAHLSLWKDAAAGAHRKHIEPEEEGVLGIVRMLSAEPQYRLQLSIETQYHRLAGAEICSAAFGGATIPSAVLG